ncbi:IS110 family transposase [Streptomyces vinaceus]|uniref:IS110 family transposase n=1 Tax=Streptomyces vinaceus TaxID=1960 RepID=UPI0036BCE6F7
MTAAGTAGTSGQWVFGGVDSHADTIHVAVVTDNGGHLADAEFPTTAAGYMAALAFPGAHGAVVAIGVEGTASYGTGFTRAARAAGLTVVEVNRPDRAERRRSGKSDPIDALARLRPHGDPVHTAVLTALKSLARRIQALTAEHDELTAALD